MEILLPPPMIAAPASTRLDPSPHPPSLPLPAAKPAPLPTKPAVPAQHAKPTAAGLRLLQANSRWRQGDSLERTKANCL